MFEQLMTLVFLAPASPSDTWSAGATPAIQASGMAIRLEVSGPQRPGCGARTLTLPPASGASFQFEDRGTRYIGTEGATGNLVLRSSGAQALTLSGSRAGGGLWSLGNDGKCVGTWKFDQPLNAKRE